MSPQTPDNGYTSSVSRRDFLRVGGLGVVGLSVAEQSALHASQHALPGKKLLFLVMSGGASQLETFDPKPESPTYIRGPVKAISTSIPGIALSEGLPRLAERLNRCTLIRSLYHHAAPLHETSLQLLFTGRLVGRGVRPPSFGTVFSRELQLYSRELGKTLKAPAAVVVAPSMKPEHAKVSFYRGDNSSDWGTEFAPHQDVFAPEGSRFEHPELEKEPEILRRAYGYTQSGTLCLRARQWIEQGCQCVTVHLHPPQSQAATWDCHGCEKTAPGIVTDYRDTLCPEFDRAVSTLLDDLEQRGLLKETVVIAAGEFGRTPRLNQQGGRDHWTHCWSALVAGGNVPEGQVIGSSDPHGAYPIDRPVHISELVSTVYHQFQLDPSRQWTTPAGTTQSLVDAPPIAEILV